MELASVIEKINAGDRLVLAADEALLDQLPKGNWIAGTIPYFMSEEGGIHTKGKIYVDEIPEFALTVSIKFYSENQLSSIVEDEFENGYSLIIIPAFSKAHVSFAENSKHYPDIFIRPLVGWISGFDLADMGKTSAKVYNGLLGESSDTRAIVMHIELPANKAPIVDIINLFSQSSGDTITFEEVGFGASECLINGMRRNLSEYLLENNIDTKLPMVADYCGAMINTSFSGIDVDKKSVSFYAPVFRDIEYRMAGPVTNYVSSFNKKVLDLDITPVFTCNCILNYLYSELEGKKTANITGPITFGEIAYQLLNQTLVYLKIEDLE